MAKNPANGHHPLLTDKNGIALCVPRGESYVMRDEKVPDDEGILPLVKKELASIGEADPEILAGLLVQARFMQRKRSAIDKLEPHFKGIIDALQSEFGYNSERSIENFAGSARRCAEALFEAHPPRWYLQQDTKLHLESTFPGASKGGDSNDAILGGMVVSVCNVVWGMCPHHLLPIRYVIHLAYIPSERNPKVLGLSKLARLARNVACQPILHEEVPELICDLLYSGGGNSIFEGWEDLQVESEGSICIADAMHNCVSARGIRAESSRTTVTAVRGAFQQDEQGAKAEFMAHVQRLSGGVHV